MGYYTYTVDGPRVTVNYYADPNGASAVDSTGKTIAQGGNPTFNFQKVRTSGYSMNGKEVVITPGASYTSVADTSPTGTQMSVLDGINGYSAATNYGKPCSKAVDTGWTSRSELNNNPDLRSDALTLWGLTEPGQSADRVVLSLSYDSSYSADPSNAYFGVRKENASGSFDLPNGQFFGNESYAAAGGSSLPLGSYGFDASNDTAWAVLSQSASEAGTYVVATPEPASLGLLLLGALPLLARRRARR